MRFVLLFLLLTAPAAAWEFTPTPVCTLSHSTDKARLSVTHTPHAVEPYAIEITQGDAIWGSSPTFQMLFDGPRKLSIATDRHKLGAGGKSLTVTDQGFGNVLTGLEFNFLATAKSGDTVLYFPLADAAEAVQRFRLCAESPEA
jgi:hypothetical protein